MGTTSRGIYIKTPGKWLIFLSLEPFRGPLTLTLGSADLPLNRIAAGASVLIDSRLCLISSPGFVISIEGCEVWKPPQPPPHLLPGSERRKMLANIAEEALKREKWAGLGPLLPTILDLPHVPSTTTLNPYPDRKDVLRIRRYVKTQDVTNLSSQLTRLLGAGQGLTPCGDDFLIGLMLALNRWKEPVWPSEDLHSLNRRIVEAAYEKTTSLSANLIECATLGLADERLINAIDWIMSGVSREPEVVSHLLGWGSSSGVDAFVGMATGLS